MKQIREKILNEAFRNLPIFSIQTIADFCNINEIPMVFKECPEEFGFKIAILKEHEEIVNNFLYYKKLAQIGVDVLVVNKEQLNDRKLIEWNKDINNAKTKID